eukprot:m.83534 g.83534  ORF g.83534 m.83534 type:complete len:724 (-) comp12925_c0_seq4:65-2236(-)
MFKVLVYLMLPSFCLSQIFAMRCKIGANSYFEATQLSVGGCFPCKYSTPLFDLENIEEDCACLLKCFQNEKCVAGIFDKKTKRCRGYDAHTTTDTNSNCFVVDKRKSDMCPTTTTTTVTTTTITSITTSMTSISSNTYTRFENLPTNCTSSSLCNCADYGVERTSCELLGAQLQNNRCFFPSKGMEPERMCYIPLNGKPSNWDCGPLHSIMETNGRLKWCNSLITNASLCTKYCRTELPYLGGRLSKIDNEMMICQCDGLAYPFFWEKTCFKKNKVMIDVISCYAGIVCKGDKCPTSCSKYAIYEKSDCLFAGGLWVPELLLTVDSTMEPRQARCEKLGESMTITCYLPLLYPLERKSCHGNDLSIDGQCPPLVNSFKTCLQFCWQSGYVHGEITLAQCRCTKVQNGTNFQGCHSTLTCLLTSPFTTTMTETQSSLTLSSTTTLVSITDTSTTIPPTISCNALIPSLYAIVMPPCDRISRYPEGTECQLRCKSTFEMMGGDVLRKCDKTGQFSGSELICGCPLGKSVDGVSKLCVAISKSTERVTPNYVSRTTTSSFSSSLFNSASNRSTKDDTSKGNSKSGMIVGLVLGILLLLLLLLFIASRYRNKPKGGVINDFSVSQNPAFGSDAVERDTNPLYEDGDVNIPRHNNPMYEGGSAGNLKLYAGYHADNNIQANGVIYNVPEETPSTHYESVDNNGHSESVLVAMGSTNWAVPLHGAEQEC